MQFTAIFRIIGILLMMFSLSMLPPAAVTYIYHDSSPIPYYLSFLLTLSTGFIAWILTRHRRAELKIRDGFLVVVLFWFVLSFFGALPLMMAVHPHDNFTDAMFESVSGFTTTGATVVTDVDHLDHAMLYYRQQLQFLGGMGILVLAVAILPMLGIGGMQLYRAETPGPIKDSKLTPRITGTAKRLWYIYVGLTVICALAYWAAGMPVFDAIGESFATVSTGGFNMHNNSFEYYHSHLIECIGIVFMLLGATNFSLHYLAMRGKSIRHYWVDEEFRVFIYILLFISGLTFITLMAHHIFTDPKNAILKSVFNVVSMVTTTGFTSSDFSVWPTFIPFVIMFGALIGGCAGSTSGGLKILRALLLRKQTFREMQRLIHPQAVIILKFGQKPMPEHILQSMWAFFAAYISLGVILGIILIGTGLDATTAFSAVVAGIGNGGAGLGKVAANFKELTPLAKWAFIFSMFAGRFEIFSLLILFTPAFWRR